MWVSVGDRKVSILISNSNSSCLRRKLNRILNVSSLQLLTKFECEVDLASIVIVKVSFGVVAEILQISSSLYAPTNAW